MRMSVGIYWVHCGYWRYIGLSFAGEWEWAIWLHDNDTQG